jgi:hypothetical protein
LTGASQSDVATSRRPRRSWDTFAWATITSEAPRPQGNNRHQRAGPREVLNRRRGAANFESSRGHVSQTAKSPSDERTIHGRRRAGRGKLALAASSMSGSRSRHTLWLTLESARGLRTYASPCVAHNGCLHLQGMNMSLSKRGAAIHLSQAPSRPMKAVNSLWDMPVYGFMVK